MEKLSCESLMIGDWVKFRCSDDSLIIGQVVEIHNEIVYLKSTFGRHWSNLKDIEPIPLTPEILEKNGFKKDAFTNLSPDYYFGNDEYSICVNLNSTCDKSKSVWIEKRSSRLTVSIEESRHSLDKKPLYVHELQHALKLCGINREINL